MPKGQKFGGRDFQPGHPKYGGRKKIPEDLKAARAMNREELERIINKYLNTPIQQLKELVKDQSVPAMEAMVISVIASGISKGDQMKLDFILNRLGIVVVQKVEHSGSLSWSELVRENGKSKAEPS